MSTSIRKFEFADNNLSANEVTTLTIVFGTTVLNFDQNDLVTYGVVIEDFTPVGDNQSFTATVRAVPGYNGEAKVTIRANGYYNGETGDRGGAFDAVLKVDTTAPLQPIITLPHPSGPNGEYNIEDANDDGTVTATITLPTSNNEFETTKPGDVLTVNGVEYSITQEMIDNGLELNVVPGEPINAAIRDVAGNNGPVATVYVADADLVAPVPTITINVIAEDDIVNLEESEANIDISGIVGGEFNEGDTVTLTINGNEYIGLVDAFGVYNITVLGSELAIDSTVSAVISTVDAAGNAGEAKTSRAYTVSLTPPDIGVTIDPVTDDNIINNEESRQDISVTGTVTGDFNEGDTVSLNINKGIYIGTVTADGNYTISVPGSALAADRDSKITAKVDTIDTAGNLGSATTEHAYTVDLQGPTNTTTQVLVDDITADNVINAAEANEEIAVTGSVTGEFKAGDIVTLTVNDKPFTTTVNLDGTFTVNLSGSDLATDPDSVIDVVLNATDPAGNTAPVVASKKYGVDTQVLAPTVVITEDINNDGVVSYLELEGDIDYKVTVGADAVVGDILTVNGTDITITQDIINDGYKGSLPPVDGEHIKIVATITDKAGNTSAPSQDSAVVNLTIPDATPIFLWHLGYNLTSTQGPTDQRGKFGGKYGTEVNYETGILNDYIYIGYDGIDHKGNLIKSRWDGDFERDCGDGNVVWTMETYAGNDFVQIRDDQNAYTVAKLGSGNDTYIVQGTLDSDLHKAQSNLEARAYIFTEEGDDTVIIGGNMEGRVYGYCKDIGIDGGRVFTGSGSDNVIIYGEVDDGGVIDLGAGRTEFASSNNFDAASSVDATGDVNTLTITHNLGEAAAYDFGYVFGGLGDDNVTVGTSVRGYSIIDLGDGTNAINIGCNVTGKSQILTGRGNDTLTIGHNVQSRAKIDLGDGQNVINIGGAVKGKSIITTGSESDVLNIAKSLCNNAKAYLGEGDDIVTIGGNMYYKTSIDLGAGNDTLTVNHMHGRSHIDAGEGNDVVTVNTMHFHSTISLGDGNDTLYIKGMHNNSQVDAGSGDDTIIFSGKKLNGFIEGGEGIDTLQLTYNESDKLVNSWLHETNVSTKNFSSIEIVEMTGQNVIDIRFADLLQDTDRDGALFIKGNSSSKVDLGSTNWNSDGTEKAKFDDVTTDGIWQLNSSTVVDGINYDIYRNSSALDNAQDVYIEQGIVVI